MLDGIIIYFYTMNISQLSEKSLGDTMSETIPSSIYLSKYNDYISTTLEITHSNIIINGNTGNTGDVLTCNGDRLSWEPVTITGAGFTGVTETISTTAVPYTKSITIQHISSVNKYKITLCGTISGINDYVLIYFTVNGISCDTFNSTCFYYVQCIAHNGNFYNSYTIIDTIDMSSSPLVGGYTAEIQMYITSGSGNSNTTNNFNVSMEPVY